MVLLYLKEFDSNLEVLIWNIKPQHSEIIQNNLNPDFEKYFVINYEFCKKLELKFVVVDVHGYYDQDYEHYSILGSVECLLEDIICEHDTKTLNLVNENLQKNSSFLRVTPVYRTEDVVVTEIILKNFEPHFQNLVVNLNKIINECDLNDDCLLKFEDEFVGSFQTTLSELRGEIGNNLDFELINERKKSAKSGQKSGILPTYKNSGFFKVSCLKYEKSCSFLDYMAGGLKFAVGFAIDTSFSTNCYDLVSSCIASFGSLLENYTRSSTKLIDLIGFDTSNTKYIAGDKYTFDLNDGIEEHTTIGHEKALETYGTLIRKNDEIEFESLISNNSSTKLPSKDKTILACQKNIGN
ncbi:hypothetical protein HK099_006349 [Clydaea vesicula]|uniref:C2 domain-containing protein n=1 Tax=Clydaea vesicula TaxID=447962 RepID=A0AAD5U819_9FUNG|nr:hypothetical protein HK099_006349 [Clydaea vesicula]